MFLRCCSLAGSRKSDSTDYHKNDKIRFTGGTRATAKLLRFLVVIRIRIRIQEFLTEFLPLWATVILHMGVIFNESNLHARLPGMTCFTLQVIWYNVNVSGLGGGLCSPSASAWVNRVTNEINKTVIARHPQFYYLNCFGRFCQPILSFPSGYPQFPKHTP